MERFINLAAAIGTLVTLAIGAVRHLMRWERERRDRPPPRHRRK